MKTQKIDERFKLDNLSFTTTYMCLHLLRSNAQFTGCLYITQYIDMLFDDVNKSLFSDLLVFHNKIGELATSVDRLNTYHNFSSWKMFSTLCYSITSNIISKQLDINREVWKDIDAGLKYMNS